MTVAQASTRKTVNPGSSHPVNEKNPRNPRIVAAHTHATALANAAGEDQGRKQPSTVELDGVGRHSEIVAAQPDCHVDGPHLVVHLVVVPDQHGTMPLDLGDGLLVVAHAFLPGHRRRGPFDPSFMALMPSILRSWCTSPYCAAVRVA